MQDMKAKAAKISLVWAGKYCTCVQIDRNGHIPFSSVFWLAFTVADSLDCWKDTPTRAALAACQVNPPCTRHRPAEDCCAAARVVAPLCTARLAHHTLTPQADKVAGNLCPSITMAIPQQCCSSAAVRVPHSTECPVMWHACRAGQLGASASLLHLCYLASSTTADHTRKEKRNYRMR